MDIGDVFQGDLGKGRHNYVVLSHPTEDICVVTAMISTWDERRKDDSCIIWGSDGHPSITHESYVVYAEAFIVKISTIEKRIRERSITPKVPFSDILIERVLKGVAKSPYFPSKCFIILDRQNIWPE